MPMKRTPMEVGKRSGMLTAISEAEDKISSFGFLVRMVNVECDCGTVKPVTYTNFMSGTVRSCGCSTKLFRIKSMIATIEQKDPKPFIERKNLIIKEISRPSIPESEMKEPVIKRNERLISVNVSLIESGLISGKLNSSWISVMHLRTREYLNLCKHK